MQANKIGKIVLIPLLATTLVAAPLLSPISAIANEISTSEETPLPVLTLDEATSGNTPDEFLVRDTSSTPSSPMLRSAMLGYEKWTLKSQVKQKTNTFIGWHPDFKAYKYNVAGYYFSSTQQSTLSVSLGYGPISLSVDKNKSSGYLVPSNINKWTRPAVYGDTYKNTYTVKKYNGANMLTGTSTKYTSTVKKEYILAKNQ